MKRWYSRSRRTNCGDVGRRGVGDIEIEGLHDFQSGKVLFGDGRNGDIGDADLILLNKVKQ